MKKLLFLFLFAISFFMVAAQSVEKEGEFMVVRDLSEQPGVQISMNVYPNPATSFLRINIESPERDIARVLLSDNIGNPVISLSEPVAEGQNQLILDLTSAKIRSGIYFLLVKTGSGNLAKKIVVKK